MKLIFLVHISEYAFIGLVKCFILTKPFSKRHSIITFATASLLSIINVIEMVNPYLIAFSL